MSVISRLKATKIIGQRKAFYRQRIPEFSRARKETVDLDILLTSRNGDRQTFSVKADILNCRPVKLEKRNSFAGFFLKRWKF